MRRSTLLAVPVDAKTEAFKSSTRADIESRGYDTMANVGDQKSDLDGGHADRAFKLPNPFYFIPD
jgi:HAD superfamily, subfamily IIIB (Acid phosphatase)